MRRWPGLKSCFSVECESLEEMSVLDLQHSNLTCVPTDIFKAERNLEEVYLDANQIRELPRVSIYCSVLILKNAFPGKRCSVCQICESCSNFFLCSICPQALFGLQSLHILGLSDNELTILPSAVANLANLREVDISKNGGCRAFVVL